jgi:hypothetical protein
METGMSRSGMFSIDGPPIVEVCFGIGLLVMLGVVFLIVFTDYCLEKERHDEEFK